MTTLPYKIIHSEREAIWPPAYKTDGASGMDLVSGLMHMFVIFPGETVKVPLGFAIELQPGFEAQIRPRSSLSAQGILCHLGTIDSDYRGELAAVLTNVGSLAYEVKPGDRIAQLVVAHVERVTPTLVAELSETGRGDGGFGSTGRDHPTTAITS